MPPDDHALTPDPKALTPREIELFRQLTKLLADQLDCNPEDVKLDAHLVNDLGADSLGLVECILAVEEQFQIDIPEEDGAKLETVRDAVAYIARVRP